MNQTIQFAKMHGLGNDFVVIDAIHQPIVVSALPIKQLGDRHIGIGFDQLLIIQSSIKAEVRCLIFNADGSEAEQCGNGIRCVTRFIYDQCLSSKKAFSIETKSGIVKTTYIDPSRIQVEMGVPIFRPDLIPIQKEWTLQKKALYEIMTSTNQQVTFFALSMGNPHAIILVDSIEQYPVALSAASIAHHKAFPQGINIGFVEIINADHIRLRTYERGVGETLSCGSNACAAVVAGIQQGLLAKKVTVVLPLGELLIEWLGDDQPVLMTGPAEVVFFGQLR